MSTPFVYEQDDFYDVLVVGASFAGLSFASVASALGLRVLVVEKDSKVGGIVRTTGVLFSDVLDILDVPPRYLLNSVRRIHIQPPDHTPVEIQSFAYRYYMADVTGMLEWMAAQAQERGVTIQCSTLFQSATREQDGLMHVTLHRTTQREETSRDLDNSPNLDNSPYPALSTSPEETAPNGSTNGSTEPNTKRSLTTSTRRSQDLMTIGNSVIKTRCVIGADGTHSRVARSMALSENTRYLAGAEWLLDGVKLDEETFYLIMDQQLAPGYCLWLAPHGKLAALGVAGHARSFSPATSLRVAQEAFGTVTDMSGARVVERKGGVIPTGGRLRHVYRDDELGCALLLGDAAGLCGAATGGGIYPALISGRLAAHAVAGSLLDGEREAIPTYLRDIVHAGRLGDYLRIEDWLRRVLDSMRSNADLAMLYGLFASEEGQRVLQLTLLGTPIISMDSNFFSLLSKLLKRHPKVYRSALDAVWQRIGIEQPLFPTRKES